MIAFCILLILAMAFAAVPIYDPMFVFCGSGHSCYDILEIRRNATVKQIRRAYRRLSLEYHPDKSKHANATEAFRLISKAYEVLDGNETRKNFDYYLDHPRDYFKVSGHHYMRQLPKSDVRLVLLLVACLISAIMHVMQEQKHNNFLKHLKNTIADCANTKSNLQTQALFDKAVELYEKKSKADANSSWATSSDTKKKTPKKMVQDPMFQDCVDEVVSSLKIEGGYRKPDYNDLFIVRLVHFPLHFYQWLLKYQRRHLSGAALSPEEKLEMAKEALGPGTWENLTPAERDELVEKEIWKSDVREKFLDGRGSAVRMVIEDDEGGQGTEAGGLAGPKEQLNRKQLRMKAKIEKKKKE